MKLTTQDDGATDYEESLARIQATGSASALALFQRLTTEALLLRVVVHYNGLRSLALVDPLMAGREEVPDADAVDALLDLRVVCNASRPAWAPWDIRVYWYAAQNTNGVIR